MVNLSLHALQGEAMSAANTGCVWLLCLEGGWLMGGGGSVVSACVGGYVPVSAFTGSLLVCAYICLVILSAG